MLGDIDPKLCTFKHVTLMAAYISILQPITVKNACLIENTSMFLHIEFVSIHLFGLKVNNHQFFSSVSH